MSAIRKLKRNMHFSFISISISIQKKHFDSSRSNIPDWFQFCNCICSLRCAPFRIHVVQFPIEKQTIGGWEGSCERTKQKEANGRNIEWTRIVLARIPLHNFAFLYSQISGNKIDFHIPQFLNTHTHTLTQYNAFSYWSYAVQLKNANHKIVFTVSVIADSHLLNEIGAKVEKIIQIIYHFGEK